MLNKLLAFVIAGFFIFTLIGLVLVGWVVPASSSDAAMGPALIVLAVIAAIIAFTAPSGAKAWRRLLITSGVMCLALPLAAMIFTGNAVADIGAQGGENVAAGQAGTIIGGGIATIFTGFVSFFAAAILLIIGFLVGRDKRVVYVQQEAPPE